MYRAIISDEVCFATFPIDICDLFIAGTGAVLGQTVLIREKSPLLYFFIFLWDHAVPECWWLLFKDVATKSTTYWNKIAANRRRSELERAPSDEILAQYEDWMQSASLYAAKLKRIRPVYDTDAEQPGEESVDGTCNKHWVKFAGLTGGLWIVRCPFHAICVGFHVEPTPEGLNDPFSSIYCHWLTEPKVTIIDFACKYISYAMRREPLFFKSGIKAVDELHGTHSHVSCSDALNIKVFKNTLDDKYALLNDSAAEQRNIPVNKVKASARYFRKEVLMVVVSQLLLMDNRKLIRRAYSMD